MTPTLYGRWQTRLFLSVTIGGLVTVIFGLALNDLVSAFALLGYITALGLIWDVGYIRLQRLRWDHDWPPFLYLAGAIWELGFLIGLHQLADLPGIASTFGLVKLIFQFTLIAFLSFLGMFGPMRVLFPRWRFRGGQWF
ncbi:MAG: hypothetical protein Fur0022_28740 [Anaerolineales bacterium]